MDLNTVGYAAAVAGTAVGLLVLLAGEALSGLDALVWIGGLVVLASVGVLVGVIARA